MAEHVVIDVAQGDAAQGSVSPLVQLICLKVDSGCNIYGFALDANKAPQETISARYNHSYTTYLKGTQDILSINLSKITEEIHFVKVYTEDNGQVKSMQLSYQAQGKETKTVLEISVGASNSHVLTLGKNNDGWGFRFGDCEEVDNKHEI